MPDFKVVAVVDLFITAKDKKQAEQYGEYELDKLFNYIPNKVLSKFKFTAEEVEEATPVANLNAV
jgi:hypothetical protein